MGGVDACAPACAEPALGYHPGNAGILTRDREPVLGHCQAGSLTGAVASKRVTEAFEGCLSTEGNRAQSIKA